MSTRRARKRDKSATAKDSSAHSRFSQGSASHSKRSNAKGKIRGRDSPLRGGGADHNKNMTMPPPVRRFHRDSISKKTPWATPTSSPITATSTVSPETPRDRTDEHENQNIPGLSRTSVPSTFTTASGQFNPNASLLNFDAKSHIGVQGTSFYDSNNSLIAGAEYSDSSPTSSSSSISVSQSPSKLLSTSTERGKESPQRSVDNSVDIPDMKEYVIEDPVERTKFYKHLKKRGIKKTLTFDEQWETSSSGTVVSSLSISAASYILDLAQQKESRAKEREEEALEEALDLYGTWLAEGKTDDKNIFLMILHEVKKEFKLKYAKADKFQDTLLDAALEEEIRRREKIKKEEDEEEAKILASHDKDDDGDAESARASLPPSSDHNKSTHRRSSSRLDEIIEMNTTQKSLRARWDDNEEFDDDVDDVDVSTVADDENNKCKNDEWKEPSVTGVKVGYHKASNKTLKRKKSIRGILGRMGSKRSQNDAFSVSKGRDRSAAKKTEVNIDQNPESNKDVDNETVDPILSPSSPEDSKNIFSRLRLKKSQKDAEQRMEEERWWKKINSVETKEELWWKKINEAQKEKQLFEVGFKKDVERENLDRTSRTVESAPVELRQAVTPTRSISTAARENTDANIGQAKYDRRKSWAATTSDKIEVGRSDTGGTEILKTSSSKDSENTQEKEVKSMKKKKKKSKENIGSDKVQEQGDTSPQRKEKKKKKKAKMEDVESDAIPPRPQSFKVAKKREKLSRDGGSSVRVLGVTEEHTKPAKPLKKKKSKRITEEAVKTKLGKVDNASTKKKKSKGKSTNDGEISPFAKNGKKGKKMSDQSLQTDDAIHGDVESMHGSDQCIFDENDDVSSDNISSDNISSDGDVNVLSDIDDTKINERPTVIESFQ